MLNTNKIIPDIFISYSRKDNEKAETLAGLLTAGGWEVWKDERIFAGKNYEVEIIEAINLSKAVVVLWSEKSVESDWVVREAMIALEQNKIIPVFLGQCKIPSLFDKIEASLLVNWEGEKDHYELSVLFNGISEKVIPSRLDNVRKGFDPFFLGENQKIMLPEVKGASDLIHYANFSVVMNPVRRLAWYVAYNVDGTQFHDGLARNDTWMPDPSWPKSLQPSNDHFVGSGWHRGHLLSPGTVCWGNIRFAGIARRQANYWTNTSPQSNEMNTKWWLALERFERNISFKMSKLTGFSGPVLNDNDFIFRDEFEKDGMFKARETFKIPTAYWKLIITQNQTGLSYAGFIVDQKVLENKKGILFRIEDHTVDLKTIEELTSLVFPRNFHKFKKMSVNKLVESQ